MLIESLVSLSGINRHQLKYISASASRRYKDYSIKKRTGGKRKIEHPSPDLKAIQRWINKFLFFKFPIHESAMAYKKGASIRKNAEKHVNSNFTLRLDFNDFFPSFTASSINKYLHAINVEKGIGLSSEDITFVCNITTRNKRLTVGAPSSPMITNVMMYDFDVMLTNMASDRELIYSRYADDIFISASKPNVLDGVAEKIEEIARNYLHVKLKINHEKTAYLSRRYKRSITGLVITSDRKISIGRERKQEIKSMVYKFSKEKLDTDQHDRLRGLIAFVMDVEDSFFQTLNKKYGKDVLNNILGKFEQG